MSRGFTLLLSTDIDLADFLTIASAKLNLKQCTPPHIFDEVTLCYFDGDRAFCNIHLIADPSFYLDEVKEWDWIAADTLDRITYNTKVITFEYNSVPVAKSATKYIIKNLPMNLDASFIDDDDGSLITLDGDVEQIVDLIK